MANQQVRWGVRVCECVCVQFLRESCLTLCKLMDCSPAGSSVRGILQARILEWVATSFSGDLPATGIELATPASAGGFYPTEPPWKTHSLFTSP